MSYKLTVLDSAVDDAESIIKDYDKKQNGLGERFLNEFEEFLDKIESMPSRFRAYSAGIHYANMKVFPYQIFFEISEEDKQLYVVALYHKRQDPDSKTFE